MRLDNVLVQQLQMRVDAMKARFEQAAPTERKQLAAEVKELAQSIATELQRDKNDLGTAKAALQTAETAARTSADDMSKLAKLQSREKFGVFGWLARPSDTKLQQQAAAKESVPEKTADVKALTEEVSGDLAVLRDIETLLGGVSTLALSADWKAVGETRDQLQKFSGGGFGATVSAVAIDGKAHGVDQAVKLRDALMLYSDARSANGAELGAGWLVQHGASPDPKALRALTEQLSKYSAGTAAAGAAVAAAILSTSPGFDAGKDIGRVNALRDELQVYGSSPSASGATIAAAILSTNPKFDAARDLSTVKKLRDALQAYGADESMGGAAIAAALLFGAPGFDAERDLAKVVKAREALQAYGSSAASAGAAVGAALAVRLGGMAAADKIIASGGELRDALQVYGDNASAAGASVAAGLLLGKGDVSPEDVAGLQYVEGALRKYGNGESAAGANLAAVTALHPGLAREVMLGASVFAVFGPKEDD